MTGGLDAPEAFRAAAQAHGPALLRVASRLLGDQHAAEDLVQEALALGFARRASYRGEARPFTWLCGILVNLARAERRRRRLRRFLSLSWEVEEGHGVEPAAGAPAAPDALARAERDAALRAALDRLPDGQRAALVLVSLEGLSAREAAAALGSTEAAVWQAVSRARTALRRSLRD